MMMYQRLILLLAVANIVLVTITYNSATAFTTNSIYFYQQQTMTKVSFPTRCHHYWKQQNDNRIQRKVAIRPESFSVDNTTTTTTTAYQEQAIPSAATLSSSTSSTDDISLSSVQTVPINSSIGTIVQESVPQSISFMKVLWQFTRPHTLIGSAMAVPALSLLATPNPISLGSTLLSQTWMYGVIVATIPALLMNLYITGLNQITDIDIDKINKPYLPLAAGTLKKHNAKIIIIVSLVLSLWIGSGFIGTAYSLNCKQYATSGLNIALWGSGILGTLYSLKPFRFKRYPILAAFCIVAVRGMIINASFFAHMKAVLTYTGTSTVASVSILSSLVSGFTSVLTILWNDTLCWYSSMFFAFFGLVIALMKDVPDVIGDKLANIRTFSVRLGQTRIFNIMTLVLQSLFTYVSIRFLLLSINAATAGGNIGLIVSRIITCMSSLVAAISVREQAKTVTPTDSDQVYTYYMHLWKLFYLSYFVLPFAR